MLRITLVFLILLIGGCIYHPSIQQGNIITDKDLGNLHIGMTKDQVRKLLGDPLIVNTTNNRMIYVYTFQANHRPMQLTRLIIYLHDNKLTKFWTDKDKRSNY